MICCINCFSDQGLKKRIEALSTISGTCNFCDSKGVIVINCGELSIAFEQIFDLYVLNGDAYKSLGHKTPVMIHEHMINYWPGLFDTKSLKSNMIKQLVNQIGRGWGKYNDEFFESPVEFGVLLNPPAGNSEDLLLQWDKFSEEIKSKNRFLFGEEIDKDILGTYFEQLVFTHPAGMSFHRARISDSTLPLDQMGKPPHKYCTPGRANPVVIPYLYVSDSIETTLYETRVALHQGISVGKFITKDTINVVSLRNIAEYGPFEIRDRAFDLEEFTLIRPYFQRLEQELSKPVSKEDIHLDYLPTQYLCEFIKSLGFDAVEYKSAMHPNGYNLAIFNDSKLECIDSVFYRVRNLTYDLQSIPS